MTPDLDNALFPDNAHSLASRFLTPAIYARLSGLKTATGFTLDQAIRSGWENPDSDIGIYAGDSESYTLFQEIFDPVIRAFHQTSGPSCHESERTSLDLDDPDPEGRYILSTRIRTARNLSGHAFTPHMTPDARQMVEQRIKQAVTALPDPFKGDYHAMGGLSPDQIAERAAAGKAFLPGDRFQEAAGITRGFPASRGVHVSHDKKNFVWVNEEDHLRIICLEKGKSLSLVFNRLVLALEFLGRTLSFAWDPCKGYLNACPTNIGTAMRAGVHIRLPGLEQHPDRLNELASAHGLQIRGTRGEKTTVTGAVFDISNRFRLGISETQIIQNLHTGITAIITAEKQLAGSGPGSPAP
jgi:creatine kinase/arginine kinase